MRVIKTAHFSKQLKPFVKKYRNISSDVARSLQEFVKESAQYLGAKLYKIRVRSKDLAKGKRGGFRMIVYCIKVADAIIPVTLYQKSETENITERELEYHLACIRAELLTPA